MTRVKAPGTKRARRTVAALDAQGYGVETIAMRAHLRRQTVRLILDHLEHQRRERRQTRKEH